MPLWEHPAMVLLVVYEDHARLKAVTFLTEENDIKLIILIENKDNIKCIEDLNEWVNYRQKWSPKATTGERLAKILPQ